MKYIPRFEDCYPVVLAKWGKLVKGRRPNGPSSRPRRSTGLQLETLEARLAPAFTQLPHMVSDSSAGTTTGNAASLAGVARTISADGRYEVFSSNSSNLVASPVDGNASSDVFVRDLLTGITTMVSVNSTGSGPGNSGSDQPTISADGRYVAFRSAASNIASPATSGQQEIFRRDLQTNTTILISINSAGTNGANGGVSAPSLSDDGNRVAFIGAGTDLVAGLTDANSVNDVFVRNVSAATTVCASVIVAGTATANGASDQPIISGDGLTVAFRSSATNLVAASDNNQATDVFVRSLATNTTTLISLASASPGTIASASSAQGRSLSDDGRYQVFTSAASDAVAGLVDVNGVNDVFIRDLQTGVTQAVSMNSAGSATANASSQEAVISGDGRYVAFRSSASDLQNAATNLQAQIYRWDRLTNTTILISVNSAGTNGGNNGSELPSISSDGSKIAYRSFATNLVALPDSNAVTDVYVRNVTTLTTTLASVNSAGTGAGNAASNSPVICADGSAVAFITQATDLVAGIIDNNQVNDVVLRNLTTSTTSWISIASSTLGTISALSSKQGRSISANGRFEVFATSSINVVPGLIDLNASADVFVRDLVNQTTTLVSVNSSGSGPASGSSDTAVITPDGRYIVFRSNAGDLTATGGNGVMQLYRRDLQTNVTVLLTFNSAGTGLANSQSDQPSISDDGNRIAFRTSATNLVAGVTDSNLQNDVAVRDVSAGTTSYVSIASSGTTTGSNLSQNPTIAGDGSSVVFDSTATDLVAGVIDNNSTTDIFSRNLGTATTTLVSVQSSTAGTGEAPATRNHRSISNDGRYHVFLTAAANLTTAVPDRNSVLDVYLHDVQTGTVTLVSINRFGTGAGNSGSSAPSISGDGQFVFFLSQASDLTVQSNLGLNQLYRWDRLSGVTTMVSLRSDGTAGGNAGATNYSVSFDGNIAAFESPATNMVAGLTDGNGLVDVYVRNISAATTVCASISTAGAATANGASSLPVVSANGTVVAFRSTAVNLTGQSDGNAGGNDVYLRNLVASTTALVSINSAGTASGNAASTDRVTVSDDGSRVAFGSDATNLISGGTSSHQLFVRDVSTSTTLLVSQSSGGVQGNLSSSDPIIAGNGRFVVFASSATNLDAGVVDSNGSGDVFRRDLLTNTTIAISVTPGGGATANTLSSLNNASGVSNDGNVVAFVSNASNLVAGLTDANGVSDVFVRNVSGGTTSCANLSTTPATTSSGFTASPFISDDGSRVVFETTSTNLLAGIVDFNGSGSDVYSFLVASSTNTLISRKSAVGTFAGNANSDNAFVSADGLKILFRSSSLNLVDNEINFGAQDAFLRNLTAATTTLVSINSAGTGSGNSTSNPVGLTPNGQFALFLSVANDLVSGLAVSGQSVYRRDLNANLTIMISVNSAGTAGANSSTDSASISDDGNIVAFRTFATNVVAGIVDGNGTGDIVYRNVATSTNFFASRDSTGLAAASNTSDSQVVSGDGSRVVFNTVATNLLAGFVDFNGSAVDIYATATATNATQLVSIRAAGGYAGDGAADAFSISDNGLRVAFRGLAQNLVDNDVVGGSDVFVRDLGTSSTILVSVDSSGAGSSNGNSTEPSISGDGRFVAFSSSGSNLAAPDSNSQQDIFRRDLLTNTTMLVTINSAGTNGGNNSSDQPVISGNGNMVAFRSFATNLVSGIADGNGAGDIFARDISGAVTRLASSNTAGTATANGASASALLSADGSRAVFVTSATDLLAGMVDYNVGGLDLYAFAIAAATKSLVSVRANDLRTGSSTSHAPTISANGLRVAFQSNAANLVDIDLATTSDVFVRDLGTSTTILVSISTAGTAPGSGSQSPSITPDGRYVVFESSANNLTADADTNGQSDVFRRDLLTNATAFVSLNSAGTASASGGSSDQVVISDDGNFVAFRSTATNLTAGDTNGLPDIFVRDMTAGVASLISKNGATLSNGASSAPAIAGNGSVVVFLSSATNLATGVSDTNGQTDLLAGFRDPPMAIDVVDIAPDPRAVPVASVQVIFNRKVNLATFDFNDLSLTLNAGPNLVTNAVSVAYVSGTIYQIDNLTGFTSNAGTYLLTVNAAAIADPIGNLGAGSASDSWVLTFTQPSVVVVGPVTPDPRTVAVPFVDVVMSEVIDLSTFDFNDLALTRNAGPNLIDNTVTVTHQGGTTYRIGNLTGLTTPDGNYVLTVDATGIQNPSAVSGTGSASDAWTMDTLGPSIVGVFFDGTFDSDGAGAADNVWSAAFRTAAGNPTLGYPAQTGATQLRTMPWSTIDTVRIKFNENVAIVSGALGVRGINVASYAIASFNYDAVNFIATWVLNGNIDTDRVILDLDGTTGAAVADALGNMLAGSWTEAVSTFPTAGPNSVNFQFRFAVGVGDVDRNGLVRNADLNLVRNNLFIDAGSGGYNFLADIDGNGLLRNADLNATRNHLFIDPPPGPGPFRSTARRGGSDRSAASRPALALARRIPHAGAAPALDALFETL